MQSTLILVSTMALCVILYQKTFFDRTYVVSKLDGSRYLVRNGPTQGKSADILAKMQKKKVELCKFLESTPKYSTNHGVRRLLRRRGVEIEERSHEYNDEAAYSINKGERIGMCLKDQNGTYENENTMFFVLMHELAHIMSTKYAHDAEFWKNFATLIEAAVEAKLYKYKRYDKEHTAFCGHDIVHTPYKK